MTAPITFVLTNGLSSITLTLTETLDGVIITLDGSVDGGNVDIRGFAFDVLDNQVPTDITGTDASLSVINADSVTSVGTINFSGSPYDVGVLLASGGGTSFVSSTSVFLSGITLAQLSMQRFTAQVTGIAGSPSFFGMAPLIAPPPTPQISASLVYVLPTQSDLIYQTNYSGADNNVYILPDNRITRDSPVVKRVSLTNTGTAAATGLQFQLSSDNPYLNLFGVDVNGNYAADQSNSEFTIELVNDGVSGQIYNVTVNRSLAPGETIHINGLLALENRADVITQLPFDFEFVDSAGNVAFQTKDVNFYLSRFGFSSDPGSSAYAYAPTAAHRGAITPLNFIDMTTGDDAIQALLPRFGGSLTDGTGGLRRLRNLEFDGDVDLLKRGSTTINSDPIQGLATWAWYVPPGVDLNRFIEATGDEAHDILMELLPTLGQQYLAAPRLTSGGQTFESKFVVNGTGEVFTLRAGRISDGSPAPAFKIFTYSGGSQTFQQFYEQVAAAHPNTQLKFVITTTEPLVFSHYSSVNPLNGSPIVVLEFTNTTEAVFLTRTSPETLDFSQMVIADENGLQIGVTLTGDTGNRNVQPDRLIGSVYDDVLVGGNSSDQLIGLDGNDLLLGLNGGDVLWGGKGDDILDLGQGASDIVVFDRQDVGHGLNTVRQFSRNQDVIGLSGGLTYNAGNPETDVYQEGNKLVVNGIDLAVLEDFTGSLSDKNFTVRESVQDFFTIPIPSLFV